MTDRVASQIKELTAEVKHIVRLQIAHSLGVVSFIALFASTMVSELTVKEHFYTKLSSVIIPGEFNIVTVTCREGYEACICLLGSGKFPNGEYWKVVPETGCVTMDLVFKCWSYQEGDRSFPCGWSLDPSAELRSVRLCIGLQ